jgi:hypothetical protein
LIGLLKENGLVYDEDSHLVWIPENAKLIEFILEDNFE